MSFLDKVNFVNLARHLKFEILVKNLNECMHDIDVIDQFSNSLSSKPEFFSRTACPLVDYFELEKKQRSPSGFKTDRHVSRSNTSIQYLELESKSRLRQLIHEYACIFLRHQAVLGRCTLLKEAMEPMLNADSYYTGGWHNGR